MRKTSKGCLVLLVALAATVGCKNAETNLAGKEYERKLHAVKDVMQRFDSVYVELETKLDAHRNGDHSKVAELIRSDMLPLFDECATALDAAVASGRNYVSKLDDSVKAKPKIVVTLERFAGQAKGFHMIRKTYEQEAVVFSKPTVDEGALQTINEVRLQAASFIAGKPVK